MNGWCRLPGNTELLYSFPHMHENGTKFETVIEKTDGTEESLITLNGWEFDAQYIYKTPRRLDEGTIIRTSCTYRNAGDRPVRFGPNTADEMCFNFAYVSPPLPVTFCNQNQRPISLKYEPGECAPAGADTLDPDPVMAPLVEGEPEQLNGGEEPKGLWALDEATVYLASFSIAGFELDVEASRITALGSMGVESGRLAFDAVAEVHVVADGVAFDVVRNFSFAGPLTISEDVAGEFDVVPDCGEKPTDDPFRYGYRDETILVQLPVTLGPIRLNLVAGFKPAAP